MNEDRLCNLKKGLRNGFETAFIDNAFSSNLALRPQFLSNDYKKGKKVLSAVEDELGRCDEFFISVAFITMGGIQPLLMTLKELEEKQIPGKILTTDYQLFTDPKALRKLSEFSNIELRMYQCREKEDGFHTKGYIFRQQEIYRIIIGSSNMTMSAVTSNREWNMEILSTEEGQAARDILGEFRELWDSEKTVPHAEAADAYEIEYEKKKLEERQRREAAQNAVVEFEQFTLRPNRMQAEFVRNMQDLRRKGVRKALFCSATATGKTIASAFAARDMDSKRVLFLVHREQIANQALKSYRRVFGKSRSYGLLSGHSFQTEEDFIFSTMQMMAKPEVMECFERDAFDFIVIDEAHHAGAESYRRIMQYFEPDFWLGMTASPDTANYDIYAIFDHNIAYELRLQQALEEDLVCPFHYFGIRDLEINGEVFDDRAGVRNFKNLVSDVRVDYLIEKIRFYGFSGDRVKGVVFCSRKDEAAELSRKFNARGYRTAVLTGENSQEERNKAIERLVTDESAGSRTSEEPLDYIFTVDIFNEGVDIPEINQVVLLRPTESPVIFVQQLGRGLRKSEGKEYVVILDFIGNYMNNFMIPVALSGDRSYNKDNMRRYLSEGSRIIPGSSTMHFDAVSRKRIYASIDSARTSDAKLLRESYLTLKYKLGRIPSVGDFKKFGSIDIRKIFEKYGSYYRFLKKYEKDYQTELSPKKEQVIEYLSSKVLFYKRVQDLALLRQLIARQDRFLLYTKELRGFLRENHFPDCPPEVEESVCRNLTNEFPQQKNREKYADCVLVERAEDGSWRLADGFRRMLADPVFKEMVLELLDYGIEDWRENYSEPYEDTNFQLYQKYTYEDVGRLLNWKKDLNALNIGGYVYDADTKTMPVFINYQKDEEAIAYEDRFISEDCLIALSKNKRKTDSSDAARIYKRGPENQGNRIYLFVRKNKDDQEAKEFYFLGGISAEGEPNPITIQSKGEKENAFEITYRLHVPVRSDIYDYLTEA